ncbi:CIA30 family protein [Aspergillus mulundensis]|uniref:NADH:ubiquinone oxidoreductase intermediate-associated protein 30 domain-containing protein n=1 Tax=Aspergillus mulundensis TaxID=1810919 RepID=A0A3D8SWQ9_9EURO|nr:Uncharacterized protein DSM5745_02520 [Aspergillus mulundensis]RDW90745.1 Uncharacterized protein DSM5745_02520 [Aspergillus mulundensis]
MASSRMYLFGGPHPWSPNDWTSQDDRVRGGASTSYLTASPDSTSASFTGTLDISTLGGAGFASQRTTVEKSWDLSAYDGLELDIDATNSDGKKYTLILKDAKGILPPRDDGRERSGLSWEVDFEPTGRDPKGKVVVRWEDLRPTYRGKEVGDVEKLDLRDIKRFSLMMRRFVLLSAFLAIDANVVGSFFGTQEGEFRLAIVSIAAWKDEEKDGLEKKGGIVVETKETIDDDESWSVFGDLDNSQPACCVIL